MCGIAGILSPDPDPVKAPLVAENILASLARRGPDGNGLWRDSSSTLLFAHTRLAILDPTSRSDQPMHSPCGRYTLVFNGEIYNYRELRDQLSAKGHTFRTTSDTEVILALFAEQGTDMLPRLRGMFAIAIWDNRLHTLTLARDPLGIKPLYWATGAGSASPLFAFASQVKTLRNIPGVDLAPNPAGHAGFYLWGSVPEPHTLYRGIRSLPAGSMLQVQCGQPPQIKPYAAPLADLYEQNQGSSPATRQEMLHRLHQILIESLAMHLRSDVPVATFLSAGRDSGAIASLAAELSAENVRALTLGFDEMRDTPLDEVPLAAEVAHTLNIHHDFQYIDRAHFIADREDLLDAMDQPTIDGINSYFIGKLTRQFGFKVALSGLGGDELFGGYPSFHQIPSSVHWLSAFRAVPRVGRAFRVVTAPLMKRLTSPKYAGLLEYGGSFGGAYLLRRGLYMPWELPHVIDPDMARLGWEQLSTVDELNSCIRPLDHLQRTNPRDFLRVALLELTFYMRAQLLRDTDWASMAHSVEIRVPFVDIQLLRDLVPLHLSHFPPLKRDITSCLKNHLPPSVLDRPKTGFTVPVREWIQYEVQQERGLRSWARFIHSRFAA
ncbi:MAG: asparagine synthase (glutamine-hydrolyzing) [Acidobacteriaceae bacterium]